MIAALPVTFPLVQGHVVLEAFGWNWEMSGGAEPASGSSAVAAYSVSTSIGVQ